MSSSVLKQDNKIQFIVCLEQGSHGEFGETNVTLLEPTTKFDDFLKNSIALIETIYVVPYTGSTNTITDSNVKNKIEPILDTFFKKIENNKSANKIIICLEQDTDNELIATNITVLSNNTKFDDFLKLNNDLIKNIYEPPSTISTSSGTGSKITDAELIKKRIATPEDFLEKIEEVKKIDLTTSSTPLPSSKAVNNNNSVSQTKNLTKSIKNLTKSMFKPKRTFAINVPTGTTPDPDMINNPMHPMNLKNTNADIQVTHEAKPSVAKPSVAKPSVATSTDRRTELEHTITTFLLDMLPLLQNDDAPINPLLQSLPTLDKLKSEFKTKLNTFNINSDILNKVDGIINKMRTTMTGLKTTDRTAYVQITNKHNSIIYDKNESNQESELYSYNCEECKQIKTIIMNDYDKTAAADADADAADLALSLSKIEIEFKNNKIKKDREDLKTQITEFYKQITTIWTTHKPTSDILQMLNSKTLKLCESLKKYNIPDMCYDTIFKNIDTMQRQLLSEFITNPAKYNNHIKDLNSALDRNVEITTFTVDKEKIMAEFNKNNPIQQLSSGGGLGLKCVGKTPPINFTRKPTKPPSKKTHKKIHMKPHKNPQKKTQTKNQTKNQKKTQKKSKNSNLGKLPKNKIIYYSTIQTHKPAPESAII